jgi:aryl-alcohol dehydrogenase-like predicted oxidoreductase
MQYGLLDRRPEESCLAFLLHHQIGVLARGVLAKGLLVNKEPATFLNYTEDEVESLAKGIAMISSPVRPADRIALEWCLRNQSISSAVIGIRTQDQLKSILGRPDEIPLTHKEYEQISKILSPNKYELHR